MKTSTNGIRIIKKYEGLRLEVYKCSAGRLTIGYGHTKTTLPGMTINALMAEILLGNDVKDCEAAVEKLVTVELNQNQFDSLVSFCFNLGAGNLAKSTLLKKINDKNFTGAADEFLKWNRVETHGGVKELPGLTKRRTEERILFLKNPEDDKAIEVKARGCEEQPIPKVNE